MNKQNETLTKILDRSMVQLLRKHTVERFTKNMINDKIKHEKAH
jgi:hypothetical protein